MKTALVYFSIYFAFYILGAYATTDILRLLKGSTLYVNARDCYCPICHNRILLKDQIPLFSYLKNKGKCTIQIKIHVKTLENDYCILCR